MTVKINGTNTAANPGITSADTDTGVQFGSDEVSIVTGGTARATVDSSGNLGVGIVTPSSKTHIKGGSLTVEHGSPNTGTGQLNINLENNSQASFSFDDQGCIAFGTTTTPHSQASFSEKLRIQNGGGISFNGDTSSDNALDDYEEGTWNPSIGGTATYDIQWGYYVKVGAMVHCWGGLRPSSMGTGDARQIQGLPFTALNSPGSTRTGGGAITWYDNAPSNLDHIPAIAINPNTTVANINTRSSASSLLQDTTDFWQNNNRANFFITYRITL